MLLPEPAVLLTGMQAAFSFLKVCSFWLPGAEIMCRHWHCRVSYIFSPDGELFVTQGGVQCWHPVHAVLVAPALCCCKQVM